ncbi:MAG: hypothetical protein ACYS0E_03520 [Planctomycetota bacterium]|jgi:hypothetical protein
MTYALLILLFAGPEPGDTPRAAVDRFVAAVRKVDLAGAYEQLGDGARGLLDKQMGRAAKRVGLDPATATPAQVIAEFEKRFANDAGKQLIAAADVALLESRVENDRATAKVRVTYAGRQETVTLTLVRTRDRWQINGVDASKARSRANEIAAIATLRNITSAQAQFQACAKADANQNGTGEYGTFGELSGAVEVRGGAKLNPPVLSTIFRKVDGGIVTRSGYHYRIFLCDAQGNAVGEEKGTKGVDAAKAETTWCAYAWPVEYGKKDYSGTNGPNGDAAFKNDGTKGRITGAAAVGAIGSDGNEWKRVR